MSSDVPPPQSIEDHPARETPVRPSRVGLIVALAVGLPLALLCLLAAILSGVMTGTSAVSARRDRLECQRNLTVLGGAYISWLSSANAGEVDPPAGWLVHVYRSFVTPWPDQDALACPRDPDLLPVDAELLRLWSVAPLDRLPADSVSYAVRDFARFPLDQNAVTPEIIACDRQGRDGRTPHHRDGICVLYANGTAAFVASEDLGFEIGAPVIVGPDSPNPELRKLVDPAAD